MYGDAVDAMGACSALANHVVSYQRQRNEGAPMTKISGPSSSPSGIDSDSGSEAVASRTFLDRGSEQVSEQAFSSISDDMSFAGGGDTSLACNGSSFGCTVEYGCTSSFGCPNSHNCGSFTER
jgi:hypothetical protein